MTEINTDASGLYQFTGLALGSYIVQPTKTGYRFIPSQITVTIDDINVPQIANFLAIPIQGTQLETANLVNVAEENAVPPPPPPPPNQPITSGTIQGNIIVVDNMSPILAIAFGEPNAKIFLHTYLNATL